MDPISIVVALAAAASAGLGGELGTRALRRLMGLEKPAEKAEESLEARLTALGETMRASARLLEEISAEMDARLLAAERLKTEAEAAERLAELNDAQRQAVARLVRAEVSTEGKKSFRQGLAANFFFFLAGVLASIATTMWFGG
jgi:hypothetical protein